jgi:membrane protease YdiL (CAAX protease family)
LPEQRSEADPVQGLAPPPPADRLAARLRGFGPLGILATLIILLIGNYPVAPLGGVLVLAWVRRSRTPWREIGYVRPRRWARDLAVGIAFGIAFKLLVKAIVMPLFGAPPINQAYHYVTGNPAALPGAVYLMIAGGGFGEETVFRGFLFERLGKVLGGSVGAKTTMVLLSAGLFALLHYPDQGLPGVEQASITGLVFGTIFAVTGRIWIPMIAHAAFDLTALAIIYGNVESAVAHLIFK